MDYLLLKSGTDVRGTAMGENADLTEKAAFDIAAAFAFWLKENGLPLRVAVGRDSRITGERLASATINSLLMSGCEVFDCGMISTPAMFMMTKYEEVKSGGSIMITASHHPSDKNGMKFFTGEGGLSSDQLKTVLCYANENKRLVGKGNLNKGDYLSLYCEDIKNKISLSIGRLDGFKIVVDAGNGVGGFFATKILAPLGADVSGSVLLTPDGTFPVHQPNPENKQAMDYIASAVKAAHADMGIIFDTDADRSAIVASDGTEINRNKLIALIGAVMLKDNQGGYIVTDSVTSDGLHEFILSHGGNHIRYKRGYKNVIDYAKKLCDEGKNAFLAIETSGHAAFKENYFLDDGAYLAVKLLIAAVTLKREGKDMVSLIDDLKTPVEEAEIRLKLTGSDWKEKGERILTDMEKFIKENYSLCPSFEGVRANTDWGFFMARMSVHDPIIPVNIECSVKGGLSKTAAALEKFLVNYGIDTADIKRLI